MPLHLIKLCVGADSIADLEQWIAWRVKTEGEQVHVTRSMPKRRDDLLAGGSLYWVVKGVLSCRQRILDLRAFTDGEGVPRCGILLEPVVVPVDPWPRGPFQGWRYLDGKEAPPDIGGPDATQDDLPADLRRELRLIGLV